MLTGIKNLFFKNRGLRQTVIKNIFWLFLAEIIARLTGLFLVVFAARMLGANEYGKFTFALSFATILLIISDLGITDISTREFSRDKEGEKKFNTIFSLEIFLCCFALLFSFVASFFITQDVVMRQMILILTVFVLINSVFGIFFSFFRSRHNMEYEAMIKVAQSILGALCIIPIIFYFPSAKNLSLGYLLGNILIIISTVFIFHLFFQKLNLKLHKESFSILKDSWPLSFGFMAGWLYIYIDSILLGYFNFITENGWYGAASRIAIASIIPANLVVKSFYPLMSNFFISSTEKLKRAFDYLMQAMIFLAFPIVTASFALASNLIPYVYGRDFIPAVLPFQILIVVVALNFINYPYAIMLIISDHQKKNFYIMLAGAIFNTVLDILLIPAYGIYGVVTVTLSSSILVLLSTMLLAKKLSPIRLFDINMLKIVAVSAFSSTLMFLMLQWCLYYRINIFLDCFLGGMVYLTVFYISYAVVFKKNILKLKDILR